MEVTSTRVRIIDNPSLYAIASVTLSDELILNDIKVYRNGNELLVRLPNSEHAKNNNQFSIVPGDKLFKDIKAAIIKKIHEQT